ncbi:MAG: hypothetical protein ABJF01_19340 [bacterium]
MSEYRIEKVRLRVAVAVTGGGTLKGDVFLQPSARYRTGPQEPAELFNEPESFVPLAMPDDQMILLAKDHVLRVEFEPQSADTEIDGAVDVSVEIVLNDGSSVAGELRYDPRIDGPRLLDFLNRHHERFLTLRCSAGVCLVNWRQIAQVRQRS